jgi:hypothetical protein
LAELCELDLRQVSERSSRSNDRIQAGANFRSWPDAVIQKSYRSKGIIIAFHFPGMRFAP